MAIRRLEKVRSSGREQTRTSEQSTHSPAQTCFACLFVCFILVWIMPVQNYVTGQFHSDKIVAHPDHRENLMSLRVIYSSPPSPGVHN